MHLLLWKTTLEDTVLYFMNFTVAYDNNIVGILGDQYLAPFSLLPELRSRIDRTKSQTDGDQSITFVTDKLDNVTFDLQARWLAILYFSIYTSRSFQHSQAAAGLPWREGSREHGGARTRWSDEPTQKLWGPVQSLLLPWAGVREGQREASGVNPKFLHVELWCLREKQIPQQE